MALECTCLEMVIVMKELGTKEEGRVLACIVFEVVRLNAVTGRLGFLIPLAHQALLGDQTHPSRTPKSSMQYR